MAGYYSGVKIGVYQKSGLPKWVSGKESTCQCRRCIAYLDLTVILNPLQVHRTNTITLILEARKPKSTDINELL